MYVILQYHCVHTIGRCGAHCCRLPRARSQLPRASNVVATRSITVVPAKGSISPDDECPYSNIIPLGRLLRHVFHFYRAHHRAISWGEGLKNTVYNSLQLLIKVWHSHILPCQIPTCVTITATNSGTTSLLAYLERLKVSRTPQASFTRTLQNCTASIDKAANTR